MCKAENRTSKLNNFNIFWIWVINPMKPKKMAFDIPELGLEEGLLNITVKQYWSKS